MRQHDQFTQLRYSTSGRESVIQRLRLVHNEAVVILKAKGYIGQTATTLIGKVLTPESLAQMFGDSIYPTWGNEPNSLTGMAALTHVEINRASVYLVLQPAD